MGDGMYNGIINVYKEAGYTSFDVVAKLRGILHQKKIGHTGTLDPAAEGVLVVCLGKATKLCDILPDHDKVYEATLLLGTTTDTEDTTGTVLRQQKVDETTYTREEVTAAVESFLGEYEQMPPMYSAIKVNGQKLYELARQGQTVERNPRLVTIYDLEIRKIELPRVVIRISCSRGTYVRSLCRDIGERLGCGGCMEHLVRTSACGFDVKDSLTLAAIEFLVKEERFEPEVHSIDSVYPEYPKIVMKPEWDKLIYNGNKFRKQNIAHMSEGMVQEKTSMEPYNELIPEEEPRFLVYDSHRKFAGIYEYHIEHREFVPYKMFL